MIRGFAFSYTFTSRSFPDPARPVRIAQIFMLAVCCAVALVVGLMIALVAPEWRQRAAAEQGLQGVEQVRLAMVVAEKVSFERGPANAVLGDDLPHNEGKLSRLREARAASDAAIGELAFALQGPDPEVVQALQDLQQARQALQRARARVDAVSLQPMAQRTDATLRDTIQGLFDVIPLTMQATGELTRRLIARFPDADFAVSGALLAVDLRENAGRLGSQFTAALAHVRPLEGGEEDAILVLRGQIQQLRTMLNRHVDHATLDARGERALTRMQTEYFERGLALINGLQGMSRMGKPMGMTTADFAALYVPHMAPIVELRDTLLLLAREEAQARRDAAQAAVALASGTGLLLLLILAGLLLLVRRRVIIPVVQSADALARIAQGDIDRAVSHEQRTDEIGQLENAIETLRVSAIHTRRLELERQDMMDELRRLSSTDHLTGLMNRRAFEQAAVAVIANARRHRREVSLLLFDLDHFKGINDQHGHATGDQVLMAVARAVMQALRTGDLYARFGGEEFAALLPDCDPKMAMEVAERARAAIEQIRLPGPDGTELRVAASFGCASVRLDGSEGLQNALSRADRAVYQAKHEGRNRVLRAAD